jgi:sugar phosphate isomerase/epimerase
MPPARDQFGLASAAERLPNPSVNRRHFLQSAAAAATGAALSPLNQALAAGPGAGVSWPIGCFNRPWLNKEKTWTYDVALDGIQAAGYKLTGMLTRTPKEPFIGSDATPEYLAELKQKIAAHGLTVNMGALRLKEDLPVAGQIKDVRKQIDNGKFIGVEYLLTFGSGAPQHYENYYKVMQDAAPYAQEGGMKVVLKPHGGASGAAEEIIQTRAKVKHPNFKIWFDAGNIIYYTGKDPVEELKQIVQHVTGVCAKDCDRQNTDKQKGNVWLEFGTGKVDFHALYAELKQAGFNGPSMVECCAQGSTPEAVTASARRNREYLEKLFASL